MDYLEKAENSESFFETIGSYKRNLNWEVVVLFYTSLQYKQIPYLHYAFCAFWAFLTKQNIRLTLLKRSIVRPTI